MINTGEILIKLLQINTNKCVQVCPVNKKQINEAFITPHTSLLVSGDACAVRYRHYATCPTLYHLVAISNTTTNPLNGLPKEVEYTFY